MRCDPLFPIPYSLFATLNSRSSILASPSPPQQKRLERSGDDFGELAKSQLDGINGIELD